MEQQILSVDPGSIAEEIGIEAGMQLVAIDNEPVNDIIDYEQLTAAERILLTIRDDTGALLEADVEKELYEPLGLNFAHGGLMSPIRSCKNHCVFCFIDQMPKGVRESLHVKDDDWRLSLIMGNYVTLTNVDDAEFARIIKRHVSPLYISVHATDGDIRRKMMSNPTAVRIMERLTALKEAGLQFHSQVVLCPGINDGEALKNTIESLFSLSPAAQTLAVVPVGLTKYRQKLYPLRCFTAEEAAAAIDTIEAFQKRCVKECGSAFVFASDEMYIIAGRELPPYEAYEDFGQIENGVGLLRKFEREFIGGLDVKARRKDSAVEFDSASGVSAAPFMQALFDRLRPYGIRINVHAVQNDYFGSTVTVSGLITATDIIAQLKGKISSKKLLIPRSMMREGDNVFLDGMRLEELENALNVKVLPTCPSDGEECLNEIFALMKEV